LWRHKKRTPNTNDHHMPLNETPATKVFCVHHCSTDTDPEQEYSDFTPSNRRPSTLYSSIIPHTFSLGTQLCALSRSTKYVCSKSLWHTPSISRKSPGEWKCVLLCYDQDENRPGLVILQLRFNYLVASFFKTLGTHFFSEAKERYASAVSAFTPVSLLAYGDEHPSFPIFQCLSRTPSHLI